jgi:hypothetical protein
VCETAFNSSKLEAASYSMSNYPEFLVPRLTSYKASIAPTTPIAARPTTSMPMREAAPEDEAPLEALPAAPVAEVPAFPVVVGPAVPAVERTVPLLEFEP